MVSRFGLGVGVALCLVAGGLATACKLELDPSLIDDHDAGIENPDGAGGSTLGDGSWGDGAGGTGGTTATGGSAGSDASSDAGDASAGAGGCAPATEDCTNGSDDDCDLKTDCDDPDCDLSACGSDSKCKAGTCTSVFLTETVKCSNTGQTGDSLCKAAGWSGCADSTGYWWFQCAGPGDCPSAWSGLTCSSYASKDDCTSTSLNSSEFHTTNKGCTTAYEATEFGYNCSTYNPGFTVRLQCQ